MATEAGILLRPRPGSAQLLGPRRLDEEQQGQGRDGELWLPAPVLLEKEPTDAKIFFSPEISSSFRAPD